MKKSLFFTIFCLVLSTCAYASANYSGSYNNSRNYSFTQGNMKKSISLDALAKDTNDKISQKKQRDNSLKGTDVSISNLKEEKDNKEAIYNKMIDNERTKLRNMKKDEFETTETFKRRQSEQEKTIANISKEKDAVISGYNKRIADQETNRKEYESSFSWDSFAGDFSITEVTLIYNVSSIQYNADTGVFDITLSLDENNFHYKVSNNLTISCESPDSIIKYQKRIPNIDEARRFKETFKKAIISIPDCHIKRSYEYKCIKEGYVDEQYNWDGVVEDAFWIGVAVLLQSSYAPPLHPAYKETYVPPVYENYLIFTIDSYQKNEKAVFYEITGNDYLLQQKKNSFLSGFSPMIKDK